ncbi:MAG: cysteine--tRNA ligase [Candidatus Taylorbacteria bacterium]|nr:cysteine--tRNA ligase [Candidatus Taylorbacteria bacterium]
MSLQLYNTLTGKKEEFRPIKDGEVGLYTCGPTVYNYAHIGNLRSYVFADVLKRTLRYNGYKVKHVLNITDVGHLTSDDDNGDDKMIKALKREGKPFTFVAMQEIARKYETAFTEDLQALNIELPDVMPRASDNIAEDIEIVQKLLEKGIAYKISDGIYFDTAKFPSYGTRGGFKLGDLKDGARVAVNAEKKNPRDFSLWKFSTTDLGWDFPPYGKGFPGWHIECSAMSRKYLGQPFDIHTGGIDHIPTHHQNEIAQSEAAYDMPLANVWMHNEFVNMGEAKMAKSGDNFITLQTLRDKGIHPLAYRYYLLGASYRTPIDLNHEALKAAQNTYFDLLRTIASLEAGGTPSSSYIGRFSIALGDDLNTAEAVSLVYAILGDVEHLSSADKRATIFDFDKVLGLDIENQSKKLVEEMNAIPDDIKKLASAREDARKAKDFKKSDELRDQIAKEGFEIMDTDSGSIVRKKL